MRGRSDRPRTESLSRSGSSPLVKHWLSNRDTIANDSLAHVGVGATLSPSKSTGCCCQATDLDRRGQQKSRALSSSACLDEAPGDDLLLHGLSHTTIGAGAFHCRVRDGIGWDHTAMVAREGVETAQGYAPVSHGYRDVTRVGTRVSTWSRCGFGAAFGRQRSTYQLAAIKQLEVIWSSHTDH